MMAEQMDGIQISHREAAVSIPAESVLELV